MQLRQVISIIALAAAGLTSVVHALEASTATSNRAANAQLVRLMATDRANQLAELASLESQLDRILDCTFKGKFYAPGEAGVDAAGCTAIEVTVN